MSNFKFIKQHDSMQCGVACLSMICKYYGKHFSINQLSNLCNPTTEGVSLKGICDAAQHLGFNVTPVKTQRSKLDASLLPCILYWNQNHFVVLYKVFRKHKYYIADPAKGKCIYTPNEFDNYWESSFSNGTSEGIALFLEPTSSFHSLYLEQEQSYSSFKFIYNFHNE